MNWFSEFFSLSKKNSVFFCLWKKPGSIESVYGKIIFHHFLMHFIHVCSIIFYGKNRSSDKLCWGKCFTSVTYCQTMANTNAVMNMDQNYWTNVVDAKYSGSLGEHLFILEFVIWTLHFKFQCKTFNNSYACIHAC